jgi:alpha-beta hydrolase superfamily lysophospholipase
VYEGARHEVFNETNRVDVAADLITWITSRIPAAEHGPS